VCAFGGSSSLNLGKFARRLDENTRPIPSPTVSPCHNVCSGPPPPPPPCPPKLPGPPPPPSFGMPNKSLAYSSPDDALLSKCSEVFSVPELPSTLPEVDFVPEIDMTKRNERNNEDATEKMYMKKPLTMIMET